MTRQEALQYLNHLANAARDSYPRAAEAIATLTQTGDNVEQILAECTLDDIFTEVGKRCHTCVAVMTNPGKNEDVTQYFNGSYLTIIGMLQNALIDAQGEINSRKTR